MKEHTKYDSIFKKFLEQVKTDRWWKKKKLERWLPLVQGMGFDWRRAWDNFLGWW